MAVKVNISYGKVERTIQVCLREYNDLVVLVPQLFDKLANTDCELAVGSRVVSELNFSHLVVDGCTITVQSLSLPFSDYEVMEQVEEYAQICGLDDELQLPASFIIPEDNSVPIRVLQEIEARLEVFDLSETAECIMREFIGPILVGAIRLLGEGSELKIRSDHKVSGRRGHGPLDYDILFHLFHVIVCEAKNGKDAVDAIPQNTAQLVACREVSLKYQKKNRSCDYSSKQPQRIINERINSIWKHWT